MKAIIETGASPVDALPDEAIVDFEGKSYIFIQNKKDPKAKESGLDFEMKEVNRGVSENGFSQVKFPDGFEERNAQNVLKGAYALLSSMKNEEEEE